MLNNSYAGSKIYTLSLKLFLNDSTESVTVQYLQKNISLQRQGNRMDHFFHIQWLGQMCVHATVQCGADIFCKSIGGQCDDGNGRSIRPVKLPDLACGFVSVHQRHHNIHKYHIKCPLRVTGENTPK